MTSVQRTIFNATHAVWRLAWELQVVSSVTHNIFCNLGRSGQHPCDLRCQHGGGGPCNVDDLKRDYGRGGFDGLMSMAP